MEGTSAGEPTAAWLELVLWVLLGATWLVTVGTLARRGLRGNAVGLVLAGVVTIAMLGIAWSWAAAVTVEATAGHEDAGQRVTCNFDPVSSAFATGTDDPTAEECVSASRTRVLGSAAGWVVLLGASLWGASRASRRHADRTEPVAAIR